MLRFLVITFCLLSLSACSIYKSTGRNHFEAKAPGQIQQSVSIQSCDNVSELKLEISSHLSSDYRELIYSGDQTEIWKNSTPEGPLVITVAEKLETDYSVCHYTFSSEEEWLKVQDEFFLDY